MLQHFMMTLSILLITFLCCVHYSFYEKIHRTKLYMKGMKLLKNVKINMVFMMHVV